MARIWNPWGYPNLARQTLSLCVTRALTNASIAHCNGGEISTCTNNHVRSDARLLAVAVRSARGTNECCNTLKLQLLCVPTCCSNLLQRNGYGFVTKNGKVFFEILYKPTEQSTCSFDTIYRITCSINLNAETRYVYKIEALRFPTRSARNAQPRFNTICRITCSINLNAETRYVYKFEALRFPIRSARKAQPRFDTICRITWRTKFSAETSCVYKFEVVRFLIRSTRDAQIRVDAF